MGPQFRRVLQVSPSEWTPASLLLVLRGRRGVRYPENVRTGAISPDMGQPRSPECRAEPTQQPFRGSRHYVTSKRVGAPVQTTNALDSAGCAIHIDIEHCDIRSMLCGGDGHGGAYPSGAAHNDCSLAIKTETT